MDTKLIYNAANYYRNECNSGNGKYEDFRSVFRDVAQKLKDEFAPKTVLDVGCAYGYLVEALRSLGVEAYGVDISEYAIAQADSKIKPYLSVQSALDKLPDNFPEKFDLVVTIEVIEHLYEEDSTPMINRLCQYGDVVVFSSGDVDVDNLTHFNVQKPEYWAKKFAARGFYANHEKDVSFISPAAVCFSRGDDMIRVVEDYERYLRIYKSRYAQGPELLSKVYFNCGDGMTENRCESYTMPRGSHFQRTALLPQNCTQVRFDPAEGFGCLVSNLQIRTNQGVAAVSSCNGLKLGDLYLFDTTDPQILLNLPQEGDLSWIEIEVDIFPMEQFAWAALCGEIRSMQSTAREQAEHFRTRENNLSAEMNRLTEVLKQSEQQLQETAAERNHLAAVQEECNARCLQLESERTAAQEQLERVRTAVQEQLESAQEKVRIQENSLRTLSADLDDKQGEVNALHAQIEDYGRLVAYERAEAQNDRQMLATVLNSHAWRATAPVRRCMDLLRRILHKRTSVTTVPSPSVSNPSAAVSSAQSGAGSGSNVAQFRITGNPVDPIQCILLDEPVKRLNLVTDTIDAGSLLGGVATALIVATEFANRYDYELRIITRNTDTNPLNYQNIMKISGIQPAKRVSYYSDWNRFAAGMDFKMELSPSDLFMATSWWSAQAIAATTIHKRFFYIIQEVETFFYNFGGEHLLCSNMMHNPDIDYIVNSGYLYHYFQEHEPMICENGTYFEPAFPEKLYSRRKFETKTRYKLFFYARPNNPRNLYSVGVQMLNRAIELGILDTEEWDVYCVGQNAPEITFCNGYHTINLGQLSWTEYAKFLGDVDIGLCLMYTPHPSYPPYDVACSGGVVLSNKMLNKTSFDACKNVILSDLEEDAFMDSFRSAVALAKNPEQRQKNYEENTICRDWAATLEDTVSHMGGMVQDV